MNNQVVITVITHINRPTDIELISLKQGLKVLHKYVFALVVPKGLDVSFYEELFKEYHINFQIEYFNNNFFGTLANYSRLVLHKSFYERFVEYEYLLIYHLDCFIFRDELSYWCNTGYDYIAAPWFDGFDCNYKTEQLWLVGNGGLSLRKTKSFIEILCRSTIRLSFSDLYHYHTMERTILTKILKFPLIILFSLGYKNNKDYYLQSPFDEDKFWSYVATNIDNPIKAIPLNESIKFAFDGNPETLFHMNNEELPFGCHAWFKYDKRNLEFWHQFITEEGYDLSQIKF